MLGYDIIGDVHGQADRLERLLGQMGYSHGLNGWRPPQGRQAIFAGDLINRGPQQVQTCRIVRSMIDAGHARAVLGNHEVHAIGYATPCPSGARGAWLRPRVAWSDRQHRAFLSEVGCGSRLHHELIGWLRTLPFVLELGEASCGIRVVHAWWDQASVDRLAVLLPSGNLLADGDVHDALAHDTGLADVIERLSRGQKLVLPDGLGFTDCRGFPQAVIWARWWADGPATFRDLAFIDEDQRGRVPALALPDSYQPTRIEGRPVFIGHYWMAGCPQLFAPKVACVDWSATRGQPLIAYRWDGEMTLTASHFVSSEGPLATHAANAAGAANAANATGAANSSGQTSPAQSTLPARAVPATRSIAEYA